MRESLETDFFDAPSPRIIAHRGASAEYPENTLPAFRAAAEIPVDYIELDVHCTRDGEVVVIHDEGLSRIATDDRLVANLTLRELEMVDAAFNFSPDGLRWPFRGKGIQVPRLEQVLRSWPDLRFVIEFKPADPVIADATLDVVRATRMERRVLFASEHLAPIARARILAPQIPTNLPASEIRAFIEAISSGNAHYKVHGDALQVPPDYHGVKLVSGETVAAAHRCGLEVHVWTINDQSQMEELLELGVDGIFTDYPARLITLLRSRESRA